MAAVNRPFRFTGPSGPTVTVNKVGNGYEVWLGSDAWTALSAIAEALRAKEQPQDPLEEMTRGTAVYKGPEPPPRLQPLGMVEARGHVAALGLIPYAEFRWDYDRHGSITGRRVWIEVPE